MMISKNDSTGVLKHDRCVWFNVFTYTNVFTFYSDTNNSTKANEEESCATHEARVLTKEVQHNVTSDMVSRVECPDSHYCKYIGLIVVVNLDCS
eukprot:m.117170 g.117170  ORF g.117170 m.117170 type:complete len:94 (-) comp13624_c0_seq6:2053-2334(-)